MSMAEIGFRARWGHGIDELPKATYGWPIAPPVTDGKLVRSALVVASTA